MGKKMKRAFGLLLALCCALVLSMPAFASDGSSLTVDYHWENNPIAGVTFSLYRVGDHSSLDDSYSLSGSFANYSVTIDAGDTSGLKAAAKTLADYAVRDGLKADAQVTTGVDGTAVASNLADGVWLVVGQRTTVDGYVYTTAPFLTELQGKNAAVSAEPKAEREQVTAETVDLQVQKIWKDDNNKSARPTEIKVELLQDGKVFDTVTLNAENSWSYTWKAMEKNHSWSVAEKTVPSGYTVSNTVENGVFVITNTKTPTTPVTPSTPGNLPQTGQLWWPVPLLAGCGVLALCIGAAMRKGRE